MAFTDLLDALGGVGRFQLVYTALLLLPCGLLAFTPASEAFEPYLSDQLCPPFKHELWCLDPALKLA